MGEKTNVLESEEERIVTAYHEAGHVVAYWFLEDSEPLLMVSIIPLGDWLGYALYLEKEWNLYTKEQLLDIMSLNLGGVVAEHIFYGRITEGFRHDLKAAVMCAYLQVVGNDENIGQLSFDLPQSEDAFKEFHSEAILEKIQSHVIDLYESYCTTLKLLTEHKKNVEKVVGNDENIDQLSFDLPLPQDVANESYSEEPRQIIQSQVIDLFKKSYLRTFKNLTKHKEDVEKVAKKLLDKDMLARADVIELLGPPPFKTKSIHEEYLDGIICSTLLSTFIRSLSWIGKFNKKGLRGTSMLRNVAWLSLSYCQPFLETLRWRCNQFLRSMQQRQIKYVAAQPLICIALLLCCMSRILRLKKSKKYDVDLKYKFHICLQPTSAKNGGHFEKKYH